MIDYKIYQKVLEILDEQGLDEEMASAICELFDTEFITKIVNINKPISGPYKVQDHLMNTKPDPVLCNNILEYPSKILSLKNQEIGGITVPVGLIFYFNGNYYRSVYNGTEQDIGIDKKYGLDYDNFKAL